MTATIPSLPLLLIAFLSFSLAWAGAFSNGGINQRAVHKLYRTSTHRSGAPSKVDVSFHMKSVSEPALSSSSFRSLSSLSFLRGGQQEVADEEVTAPTAASDETTVTTDSTAESINMKRRYGTQDSDDGDGEAVETKARFIELESEVESSDTDNKPALSKPVFASVLAPATSLLKTAASFYTQQLTRNPIITKSLTAGIIFGLSDWCAQLIERGEKEEGKDVAPLVFSRILMTFLVGLLFFGPAANAWYSMIFKILPSTSLVSTLQKAALGQVFFGPIFTCVFFGAGMIQSGSFSVGSWLSKIRNDLPAVWVSGLGFWPLVDFISFKVVPVQWIPLFVNFCSFVWTIYLSLVANKSKAAE